MQPISTSSNGEICWRRYFRPSTALAGCAAPPRITTASIDRRGLLEVGYFADVVCRRSRDPSPSPDRTPHLATGVREVVVNGERVVREQEHTGVRAGRVVRGGTRGIGRLNRTFLGIDLTDPPHTDGRRGFSGRRELAMAIC